MAISFRKSRVKVNVSSNFLKSVYTQNFLCATFYQHSFIFRTSMKYVQKTFKKKNVVRSKFSCVRSFHELCAHAHAHSLEETLVRVPKTPYENGARRS